MATLTFQNKTLAVINKQNQIWLSISDIANALGYKETNGITRLYNSHQDEFTPCMTQLVDMPTAGGMQKVRIFSLRGCHLIGMLSHTKVAKEFRRWVLDILDKEIGNVQNSQPNPPLVKPTPQYFNFQLEDYELEYLLWAFFALSKGIVLCSVLEEPLQQMHSAFSPTVSSFIYEYGHVMSDARRTLEKATAQIDIHDDSDLSKLITFIRQKGHEIDQQHEQKIKTQLAHRF